MSLLLSENFGSGWSEKQLMHCLRSAESFSEEQIISALRRQLSWTHLKTISYVDDQLKRQFYLEMAISQRWNTRTLSNQINKMLYERTSIAQKPKEQISNALDLLFCSEGNTEHIELLMLDEKEIKVAQYLTELPSKEWLPTNFIAQWKLLK